MKKEGNYYQKERISNLTKTKDMEIAIILNPVIGKALGWISIIFAF